MGDQLDRDRHADKARAGSAMTFSTRLSDGLFAIASRLLSKHWSSILSARRKHSAIEAQLAVLIKTGTPARRKILGVARRPNHSKATYSNGEFISSNRLSRSESRFAHRYHGARHG